MNKDSLAIDCTELFKTYPGKPPVEAVRGVNLQVCSGERFGVLGPNGAGKTTTIEILEGLLPPTSGSVRVLDREWATQEADIRQRVGVSLQETKLSDRLTVAETTALFRSFYQDGLTPEETLELVDLTEKSKSWVKTLSGGQKQRLAVALAIVGDPDLLFLDEPTTGLDPGSRHQLWDIIRSFRARHKTVMITTHYMEEAERLCDRVAIIDQGRVIALGTPRELIASLGAEHVVEFTLPAELTGSQRQALVQSLNNAPVLKQSVLKDSTVHITTADAQAALRQLFELLEQQQVEINSLTTRHASLEDVFLNLTGRHLNEGLTG